MTTPVHKAASINESTVTTVSQNMTYRYVEEKELLIKTYSGELSKADFLRLNMRLKEVALFQNAGAILVDFRGVNLTMNYDDIMCLSRLMLEEFQLLQTTRVSFVANMPLESAFAFSVKRLVEEACSNCAKSISVSSIFDAGLQRLLGIV